MGAVVAALAARGAPLTGGPGRLLLGAVFAALLVTAMTALPLLVSALLWLAGRASGSSPMIHVLEENQGVLTWSLRGLLLLLALLAMNASLLDHIFRPGA